MNLEIDKRMNSAWPNSARCLALPARHKGQSRLDSKSRRGALGAPPGRSPCPARGWRRGRGWRLGWRGTARSGGGALVEMGGCARQGLSVGGSPTRPGVDGVEGKRWHGGVPRCSGAPTVTGGRVNSYSMVRGRGGEGGWLNFGEGP
jgi:hypothetical protein